MKRILHIATLVGLVLNACTEHFEDMNKSNYQPKEIEITPPDTTGGGDTTVVKPIVGDPGDFIYDLTYNGVIDDHQRTTNLFHDLYAHYFADNKFSQSCHYLYNDSWMYLRWEHFYTKRFQGFKAINKVCLQDTTAHFRNAYHIAYIQYYLMLHLMTDTYGPIPFTSVIENMQYELENDVEVEDPDIYYDTQDVVYDKMLKALAYHQASIDLTGEKNKYNYDTRENIYNGDALKWKKFANSLRLRLAMRLINVSPSRAKAEAEAAIAAGLMESNDDTYAVKYDWGGPGNTHENDYAMVGHIYGDVVMSKDLELMYKNQSAELDPRCRKCWFLNGNYLADLKMGLELPFGEYAGMPNGTPGKQHSAQKEYSYLKSKGDGVHDADFWFDYNRPFECLNYAEVCFLMAEASLRGFAGAAGTPQSYYEEGIRASMDYYEVPTAEADNYITGLKNDPFPSGDKEKILEQIINQKWLANFPNGAEGWADFRRTDYPALADVVENRANDVPRGKFIKRINYPVSEHDLNGDNVYYPYGTDDKGIRLWWDVDDTNQSAGVRNAPNNFR